MGLGAEASPKMPRPEVFFVGKGHVASQNESGSTKMVELCPVLEKDFKEINRRLDERDNYLDIMYNHIEYYLEKKNKNNQRSTGLQLQAHLLRLAVKADAFQDKNTRERKEDVATNE